MLEVAPGSGETGEGLLLAAEDEAQLRWFLYPQEALARVLVACHQYGPAKQNGSMFRVQGLS